MMIRVADVGLIWVFHGLVESSSLIRGYGMGHEDEERVNNYGRSELLVKKLTLTTTLTLSLYICLKF